jgi:hypothetical protein
MVHNTHTITTAPFHSPDSSVVGSPFRVTVAGPGRASSLPPAKSPEPWIRNPPISYQGVTQYTPPS